MLHSRIKRVVLDIVSVCLFRIVIQRDWSAKRSISHGLIVSNVALCDCMTNACWTLISVTAISCVVVQPFTSLERKHGS